MERYGKRRGHVVRHGGKMRPVAKFPSISSAKRFIGSYGLSATVVPYDPISERSVERSHHNNHGTKGGQSGTYTTDLKILSKSIGVKFAPDWGRS